MTTPVSLEPRTVLVVGNADEPRDISQAVLTECGFAEAERVDTLADAASRLRTRRYDLVLLPIADAGVDALTMIEHDIRPVVPYIIGTAPSATQELILGALRAGIPEYVAAPLTREEFDVAVRRLLRRMEPASRARGMLVAVYSGKGGLGTTSVAVNLATALARENPSARVALVDLVVVGGDIRVMLDLKPAYDIGDLVMKVDRIDGDLLTSLMTNGPAGTFILPSSDRPEVQDLVDGTATATILEQLRLNFHFVVLDLDHYIGERTIGALDASDRVILVTQLSVPALRSTQRTLDLFNRLGYPPAKVQIVVNRWNAESALTIKDAETVLGRSVSAKLPNDFSACADATTKGIPVLEHEPGSSLSSGFRRLAAELGQPPANLELMVGGRSNGMANNMANGETRKRRLFRLGRG